AAQLACEAGCASAHDFFYDYGRQWGQNPARAFSPKPFGCGLSILANMARKTERDRTLAIRADIRVAHCARCTNAPVFLRATLLCCAVVPVLPSGVASWSGCGNHTAAAILPWCRSFPGCFRFRACGHSRQ